MKAKLISLLLLLGLCLGRAQAASPDLHTLAQAVDEHYNHLHTLQAEFTEIYRGAGMDRTESGTLWLKKPGKMRWEYRSPRDKLFLSDGKDAWFYVPGDKQVRKTPVKKLDDLRSPLGFLLGKTRLEKELQGLGFAPDVAPLDAGELWFCGVFPEAWRTGSARFCWRLRRITGSVAFRSTMSTDRQRNTVSAAEGRRRRWPTSSSSSRLPPG